MPRFVILLHDWPAPHWDFLAEAGGSLRAWRLLAEPRPGEDVPAEPNFPHRVLYLDYEGPLSGDRGTVARWDAGECTWLADEPERVELDLSGAKLNGTVLIRPVESGRWTFRFTARAPASG